MSIDLNMSSITNQLVQFVSEIAFFSLSSFESLVNFSVSLFGSGSWQ